MGAKLEEYKRRRAEGNKGPALVGQVSVKDSRRPKDAHVYPVYYWGNQCMTVGVSQLPQEGRPVPWEAWALLQRLYRERDEQPFPMLEFGELVAACVKATWDAGEWGPERAWAILKNRLQVVRCEVVRMGSLVQPVMVTRFHPRPRSSEH